MSNANHVLPREMGNVMRDLRTRKKLTQAELAFDAEINVSYYSAVENGENNITILKFFSLCSALHEQPSEVMRMVMDRCATAVYRERSRSGHY